MNNYYVLRATNFFYDDSYTHDTKYSHWRIHSKYDNLEFARTKHQQLEIETMRKFEPYLFCELDEHINYETTHKRLSDYIEKEFNLQVDDSERKIFFIPQNATDNQVLEIKHILNVEFYKMIEFIGDIIFYKPVMNESFWGQEFVNLKKPNIFEREYKGYAFYNSKEDATLNIPKILNYWIATYSQKLRLTGLNGKVEELSERQFELVQFLEKSENFRYNLIDGKIEIKGYSINNDNKELIELINLLVEKPYELLTISYEEARRLGYLGKTHEGDGPYGDGCYYGDDDEAYYI